MLVNRDLELYCYSGSQPMPCMRMQQITVCFESCKKTQPANSIRGNMSTQENKLADLSVGWDRGVRIRETSRDRETWTEKTR